MEKTVYVVGIGAGDARGMTLEAKEILEACDVIVGYPVYTELVRAWLPEKIYLTTPMRRERERVLLCFAQAEESKRVALVCSGDAGVYGMASLAYEVGEEHPDCEVRVIAGVTAACSGAALLGAPIGNDFCAISLSDALTPWETIEKRLRAAATADFCIVLYNPQSRTRPEHLRRAAAILAESMEEERLCGCAENIGREAQAVRVCTLGELRHMDVNMFTTIFIGNSATKLLGGHMVSVRGYREASAADSARSLS